MPAPRDVVWGIVGDPWHEPRWWPRVTRVEGVTARGWTSVLLSKRGNPVRIDWSVEVNQQPTVRRWVQELAGTPFERLLRRNAVTVRLAHADGATEVELEFEQQLRGWTRFAPWMVKRATRRQLDAALDGLEAAIG